MLDPFDGELEQEIQGFFNSPTGDLVAWGRDQEWIDSDWGDATSSFWVEGRDGIWRKQRLGELGTSAIARDVANEGRVYVAVGDAGYPVMAWRSDDGEHWTPARITPERSTEQAAMTAVAAGSAGFLAVGQGRSEAAAWFSPDGSEWTQIDQGFPEGSFSDIVATPEGDFLVVGIERLNRDWDGVAWTVSGDGREWQPAKRSDAIASDTADDSLMDVWAHANGYVALGEHGANSERLTCDDGSASLASTGSGVAHGPCWSYDLHAYTSPDGVDWQRFELDTDDGGSLAPWDRRTVARWGDKLVAVGAGRDFVTRIWLSDDGVDWEPVGEPILIADKPAPTDYQRDSVIAVLVTETRLVIGGQLDTSDGFVMIGTSP